MDDKIQVLFNVPYINLPITNVVVMSWIIMVLIIIWAFLATKNLKAIPKGLQNTAEIIIEFLNNFVQNIMGSRADARRNVSYIGTVFLFLALSNAIGALFMSELTNGLIAPPTRSFAIPVGLAIMTMVFAITAGIKKKGILGFLKRLFEPTPIMFPFNLLDFIIKPLSLALRLFGNICGAYIVMELLEHGVSLIVPSFASMYLDLFDGGIQTYVFTLLTALYIAEEVHIESEENSEEKNIKKKEENLIQIEEVK